MSDITLQIALQSPGMVASGGNVLFDTVVYSDGTVDYDSATGVLTFSTTGRYIINWWVATQSSLSTNGAVFALSSSQSDLIRGNSPVKTGTICGMGSIGVASAPVTVSLVNSSTATFYYAPQVPLKATLIVLPDGGTTDTMGCFAVSQLANILSQMITAYSTTTWTVFSSSLASYSGTPLDLYTSPNANGPGILRLLDVNNNYEALPIAQITAIYPGDGTVYDPAFTFLSPPVPLPPGCDTDMIAAVQSYLPLGTPVDEIRLGPAITASGEIYRNEYGVLVLSDADGNTPVFIATPHILRIFTINDPTVLPVQKSSGKKPSITIEKG
ncbi:MAG TPA: hypothetical protein PKA10_20200 [Selenomonadales bacterium]|nr:hypothetical protein [Selenomonadales bacterium]